MSNSAPNVESAEDIAVFESLRQAMAKVHKSVGTGIRSQHPKAHGVVQATFQICELPEAYRVGVFARPQLFAAYLRFSNGKETDDHKPDIHGLAIKLLDVPGSKLAPGESGASTQDFILADHPVFFAKDARHFLQFLGLKAQHGKEIEQAKTEGKSAADLAALDQKQKLQLVAAFPAIRDFFSVVKSPLALQYFSQVPFQFGDRVVKYFSRPAWVDLQDPLRQALENERVPVRFEFGIEVQTDPSTMPIDDATQKWNSPEQVVLATITIPSQDFLSKTRVACGEALSYSPWHSLPEHRPLGSLNRARRDVYVDSSETRHSETGSIRQEPDVSQFNLLTLTRFFECYVSGDYRGMRSCLHPDVQFQDVGFDLRGKKVGAMWHMIVLNGIRVSFSDLKVDGQNGTAHWECDYLFHQDAESKPRPVHNVIESRFRFEGGLIREHHDTCDFWTWFEQAIGPIAKGTHFLAFLESHLEKLVKHNIPLNVEERVRAKVKQTASDKIQAFVATHPEYSD